MLFTQLLQKYPLISDQISIHEITVVLRECEKVLQTSPLIEGDIVEFGCYAGTTSLFLQRLLHHYQPLRNLHVYDSFEGLPLKTDADINAAGIDFIPGELSVSKRQFIKNFERAKVTLPHIHKGWFSELTTKDIPEKICFAFLDGDFYTSILDSLEKVWTHMQPGSTLLIHDYNRETLPGVARAVTHFAKTGHLQLQPKVEANIAIIIGM